MIFKTTYDYRALCRLGGSIDNEPIKRTFDSFGKIGSSSKHILWRGEFSSELAPPSYYGWNGEPYNEDFITYMSLCKLPKSKNTFLYDTFPYCFSYSFGENEYEARYTGDVITPLKMAIPEDDKNYDPLEDRDVLQKICKKLNWHLPNGYQDFTI